MAFKLNRRSRRTLNSRGGGLVHLVSSNRWGVEVIYPVADIMNVVAGDDELLEANTAYPEILPGRGESHCEVARKLHERVSGGMISLDR